uniref:Uncharacterized protein n=1 Tax=Zea mays TaxID=4577 RepID=A0A804PJ52_MAIZE
MLCTLSKMALEKKTKTLKRITVLQKLRRGLSELGWGGHQALGQPDRRLPRRHGALAERPENARELVEPLLLQELRAELQERLQRVGPLLDYVQVVPLRGRALRVRQL